MEKTRGSKLHQSLPLHTHTKPRGLDLAALGEARRRRAAIQLAWIMGRRGGREGGWQSRCRSALWATHWFMHAPQRLLGATGAVVKDLWAATEGPGGGRERPTGSAQPSLCAPGDSTGPRLPPEGAAPREQLPVVPHRPPQKVVAAAAAAGGGTSWGGKGRPSKLRPGKKLLTPTGSLLRPPGKQAPPSACSRLSPSASSLTLAPSKTTYPSFSSILRSAAGEYSVALHFKSVLAW